VAWLASAVILFAGISMVTNLRFYSGKEINLRKSVPFFVVLLIVLFFILVSTSPPEVLLIIFTLYGLSGYVYATWNWLHRKKTPKQVLPEEKK
jgi:CDP-diacylglycerol--serine O-phosphatidyltransferase